MLEACKSEVELKAFAQAQLKIVNNLMKKNKELTEEVERLTKLTSGVIPIIKAQENSSLEVSTDQEEIAKIEIRKLKERCYGEPLTLEEAKRLEIYTKILNSSAPKDKKEEREVKELGADALLAIAEGKE